MCGRIRIPISPTMSPSAGWRKKEEEPSEGAPGHPRGGVFDMVEAVLVESNEASAPPHSPASLRIAVTPRSSADCIDCRCNIPPFPFAVLRSASVSTIERVASALKLTPPPLPMKETNNNKSKPLPKHRLQLWFTCNWPL